MNFRLTAVAMTLSVLAVGPVYAGGAGNCNFGGQYQQTSVEPQELSEAAQKLASLSEPASDQEVAAQAAASLSKKADASTAQAAEQTTTQ